MAQVIVFHLKIVQSTEPIVLASADAKGNSSDRDDYEYGIMRQPIYEKTQMPYTSVEEVQNDIKHELDVLDQIKKTTRYEFIHGIKGVQDLIAKDYKNDPELQKLKI